MRLIVFSSIALAGSVAVGEARADAVVDWMVIGHHAAEASRKATPGRMLAREQAEPLMALAMFEAANTIERKYRDHGPPLPSRPGASPDAAVSAAAYLVLSKSLPDRAAALKTQFEAALTKIPEGEAKNDGLAIGREAAAYALAQGGADAALPAEPYRPEGAPGVWLPTALPNCHWTTAQTRPFVLSAANEVRPPPPPSLRSAQWARDLEEVRAVGAYDSKTRSVYQTQLAQVLDWVDVWSVMQTVANRPDRTMIDNAHFYATAMLALHDSYLAGCEGKMFYRFWRPITAIRNADHDGNPATEREPGWEPLLTTPNHPEYPCAHCITGAALAEVLRDETQGPLAMPSLSVPDANLVLADADEYGREVSVARIYAGVHYRFSVEAGQAMGRAIAARAKARLERVK